MSFATSACTKFTYNMVLLLLYKHDVIKIHFIRFNYIANKSLIRCVHCCIKIYLTFSVTEKNEIVVVVVVVVLLLSLSLFIPQ